MRAEEQKDKCRCGGKIFEDVDATPVGGAKKRYFTRCKKCGCVVDTYRCGTTRGLGRWVQLAAKLVSGI